MTTTPFPLRRFSTENVPHRDRLAFVHDFLARHVGGLDFRPADRDRIRIDMEAMPLPEDLTVGRGFYAPMHGSRTRYLLQDGRQDYFLTIHKRDHEVSVDGKKPIKIAAGDATLVDGGVCFDFWFDKDMAVDVIWLERKRLTSLLPRVAMQSSYVIPSASASIPLLAGYVETLRRNPPPSVKAGQVASRHVYDLVALVLDGFVRGGAERNENSIAAARLKLIQKDILERLSDPGLQIDAVARRQRMTPRYVQQLFKRQGTTFSDFVREHRLELAFRLLRERSPTACTITDIAFDAGFPEISSFNRAFRARFDATPSEVRAAALSR